ncbi:MAG: extracellular solute-binding protein, partial [Planctomycetota bacterium]|nr:extracellular solute-binding protein [Planctomycetota bacterium]
GAAALPWLASCGPAARSSDVLKFWTIDLGQRFRGYIESCLRAFEAAHPGVRVDWVDVPFKAMERKLIASAAAGRAPDVVNMSDINFTRFVGLGAFAEITPHVPGGPEGVSREYLPGALDLCRVPDRSGARRLMGLPWYLTPQVALMNREALAAGGMSVADVTPTWSALAARAAEFRARSNGTFLFSQDLGEESQIPIMLLGEGLAPFKGDNTLEPDLRRPEVIAYIRAWVELYRSGAIPREAGTTGHAHLVENFQRGQTALINIGPSFIARVKSDAPGVYKALEVGPGITATPGSTHIPVMVLTVGSQSKRPDLAAALAAHMTSAANQLEFCRQVPILPSTRASLADPLFARTGGAPGEDPKLTLGRAIAAECLPEAVAFTPALEPWPDMRRAFEERFKRVLLDGLELDAQLALVEEDWARLLQASGGASPAVVPRPYTATL